MNVSDLFGETTDYDKKLTLEVKKPKSWCKSVSAFANTLGGALIFGVANNGDAVGLQDAQGDSEIISEQIKARLSPIPEFRLSFPKTEDGKILILLEVPAGQETPYYYVGDGSTEAYIRVGNESVPANASELKRLVLRGRNSTYDSLNSGYDLADYSFSKLRERYKEWTGNSFTEKDFVSFGIADNQGKLTNAGALLADASPIRHSRVFCTRWNGKDKSGGLVDALDSAEYSGSIISLLNDGSRFIKHNSKTRWRKTPNSREEMPDYQERSYFEALVNALIHRDYLINGSEIHVDIFDDRMVIYSPGGMPDGTFIQNCDIETIPSTRRNPVLADIFARLGYMERQGSGLGKIIANYEHASNFTPEKEPVFFSTRTQFTVTFPNLNFKAQNKAQDKAQNKARGIKDQEIISIINQNPQITQTAIAEALGVSRRTVQLVMADMTDRGLICHVGSKKAGHWEAISADKMN